MRITSKSLLIDRLRVITNYRRRIRFYKLSGNSDKRKEGMGKFSLCLVVGKIARLNCHTV